jgi:hypothetical protein
MLSFRIYQILGVRRHAETATYLQQWQTDIRRLAGQFLPARIEQVGKIGQRIKGRFDYCA